MLTDGTFTIETYPPMFRIADDGAFEENENYDFEIRVFTVPMDWAEEWVGRMDCYASFDEFLSEFTWDDTYLMYQHACADNVVLHSDIEPR